MFRKKWVAFVAMLGLVLVFDPVQLPAQFGKRDGGNTPGGFKGNFTPMGGAPGGSQPGGFGRGGPSGGGFKMDPEMAWAMMQRSTQSTGDTIDLSKMDPRMRDFARQRAERDGSIPLPDNGIMTKTQYIDHLARSEAAKAAKAAAGGGPGGATVVTLGPGGPAAGGPMAFPAPGGPGSFPGGPGGFGGGGEDRAAQRLKEQDKDHDGRVSFAEADGRLKENFAQIDRNGDGYVDLEEYRGYYASRNNPGGQGGPGAVSFNNGGNFNGGNFNGGNWGDPNGGNWGNRKDDKKETQEAKPIAMRYGFLPKDLPEWFDKYDDNKDGQVALHEWRKAGDDIAKFQEMDLNGDGLITADELLRFNLKQVEDAKIAALNGEGGGFSRPSSSFAGRSSGGFSLPGSTPSDKGTDKVSATNDKGSDKASSSKGGGDKPNPFREGGKKAKNN